MPSKTCTHCQRTYDAQLTVCPHCHTPAAEAPIEVVEVMPAEDIIEISDASSSIDLAAEKPSGVDLAAEKPSGVDLKAEPSGVDLVAEEVGSVAELKRGDEPPKAPEPPAAPPTAPELAAKHEEALFGKRASAPPDPLTAGLVAAWPKDEHTDVKPGDLKPEGQPAGAEAEGQPADPKKTSLRRKVAPGTQLAAKGGQQTQLAPQGSKPTQLAGPDEALELPPEQPEGEKIEEPAKADPKKTSLRRKIAPGTQLARKDVKPTQLAGDEEALAMPAEGTEEISEEDLLAEAEGLSVDLGPKSGVDVIAEELESANDLKSAMEEEGVHALDESTSKVVRTDDSDVVDLGGRTGEGKARIEFVESASAEVSAKDLIEEEREVAEVKADDLLTEPALAAPEVPAKAKKKKKVVDEEEEAPRKAKPRKSRMLAGMFVGLLLALLLAVGGLGAAWYFAPMQLQEFITKSPNFEKPRVIEKSPAEKAQEALARGEYKEALAIADGDDETTTGVRGEARWLQYLADIKEKKAPFDPKAPEVSLALKELRDGKRDIVAGQVEKVINEQQAQLALQAFLADQKKAQDLLIKEKILAPDDPRLKSTPQATAAAIAAKQESDKKLEAVYEALVENKLPFNPAKFAESFASVIKDLTADRSAVAKLSDYLKAPRAELPKKVEELDRTKQALEGTLATVNETLKSQKIAAAGAKGVEELASARTQLQKEVAAFRQLALDTLKELNEGKNVQPGPDLSKQLTAAAKAIREKAKMPLVTSVVEVLGTLTDLGDDTRKWLSELVQRGAAETQLKYYQAREPLVATPERKIDTWVSLFQDRGSANGQEMTQAIRDAQWVLSPHAKAGPERTAKAVYLLGLIARNQRKFDDARKHLQQADKMLADAKLSPAWAPEARQALKELQDPTAYYLPRAEEQRRNGQLDRALQTVNIGLQALPQSTDLKVLRSLVQLEMAQREKKVAALEAQIRADAQAGTAADGPTKARAFYVLGRLDEALGKLDEAEANYRKALAAVPAGREEDANLYRIALGRLLLRVQNSAPALDRFACRDPEGVIQAFPFGGHLLVAYQQPKVKDKGKSDEALEQEEIRKMIADARALLKSEEPKKAARIDKWLTEAEARLLKGAATEEVRGQGYMLLGRALTEVGRRTDGLKAYLAGLRLFAPGVEADQLAKMVETHPAFQLPDSLTQPNPAKAEAHFGQGVHLYYRGRYEQAELEFARAIGYHGNDARYYYYLALSQLGQNSRAKREQAEFNFEQAARLEIQSQPGTAEVNESLERIQGRLRQTVDGYRRKAALQGVR